MAPNTQTLKPCYTLTHHIYAYSKTIITDCVFINTFLFKKIHEILNFTLNVTFSCKRTIIIINYYEKWHNKLHLEIVWQKLLRENHLLTNLKMFDL